jgi:hypothetical protein
MLGQPHSSRPKLQNRLGVPSISSGRGATRKRGLVTCVSPWDHLPLGSLLTAAPSQPAAAMGAGSSTDGECARVSHEYRRREAERARRIVNPRRYGSPDALPETEHTPPVRTTQPAAPSPISPKVAPQPEQPAPPQPAPGGPPAGQVLIALQVPPGCQPGQLISAQHNGQTIQAACPPGCPPGATFQVQVPAVTT